MSAVKAVLLAGHAADDWGRLLRGYADAAAPLAREPTATALPPAPTFAMCERMLVRAAKEGAQALAWADHRLDLAKLAVGAGRKARERFAAVAELATVPAEVPVAFAQVHRAFAADEDRSAALVAMFVEAGRRAELLVEQLELAGQAEPGVRESAAILTRALPRAGLRPFRPRVRTVADFDRVRATGYVDGTPGGTVPGVAGVGNRRAEHLAGRVAEVKRTGLAWHGNVLRKADVIVFDTGQLVPP